MAKSGGKNADDCVRIVIEPDAAADHIWIGAIGAAPQAIADHRDRRETERKVLGSKQSSDLRGRAQHRKVVGMRDHELETLRMAGASQILASASDRAHIFKYPRSISEILQFGHGERHVPQSQAGLIEGDSHQAVGFGKRKRAQQNRTHDAEHRGVGADPQGHGQDRRGGESGLLAQHAQAVSQILDEGLEKGHTARFTAFFFGPVDSAELDSSPPHCFLERHAAADQILGERLDVKPKLHIHFTLHARAPESRA